MNIYVPGKGNPSARIAIVGEAPSYEEENVLTPFVGASGRFLDQLLYDAGIKRDQCWITNVCKYMVPPNPKKGKKIPFLTRAKMVGIDINQQITELRTELYSIKPNIVICLGGTALWAMTGKKPIQVWRGSLITGMGFKVIATYHPAHILHQEGETKDFWNKPVMVCDLKRALKHSYDKELNLPYRNLHVCKSSHELADFIHRHRDAKHPAVDIEAMKCIPICVGLAFTPQEGITVPLWNKYDISEMSDSELVSCWRILAQFLAEQDVVGQNFGYDRDKIYRLGFIIRSLHSDTMLKAFCINPEIPKNLAFNTSIYTEEPYYKDEGMYEGAVNDLLIGCARDACCTKEVDIAQQLEIDELGTNDYYRNFILPLHELYHFSPKLDAIEQVGFRVNEEFRLELMKKYIEWDEKNAFELYKLTGKNINVNSPKQVNELLYDEFKLPLRNGVGEEVLTQILASLKNPNYAKSIELILESRRVKKTIASYLYSPSDFDGRMRTSYFLCLETGRSATQQQEPPIRPQVEYKDGKVSKKQARGMAFQTITKHGDIGQDIRKMLIPDDGCVFLQADSSQAEARVIFLLAREDLRLFDEHDLHALTASWFFGGTEDDYSKKKLGYESPIRFAGKTLRHAGHLGAGKRRASVELNTQARKNKIDIRISEAKAEQALKIFHARQPNIKGVFHADIRKALENNRRLVAPVPYGINAKVGGVRIFFERWGDELFRQAFSYLPQRTVSENTKGAGLRIRKHAPEIKILVEAHDALLFMVKESEKQAAAQLIREEFERPIDFSTCTLKRGELVIPCDIEEGYNYKDLGKFRGL